MSQDVSESKVTPVKSTPQKEHTPIEKKMDQIKIDDSEEERPEKRKKVEEFEDKALNVKKPS